MFGEPGCDWCGDSVAAHAVSGGVAVVFAVCPVEGVVVGPAHESFTFEGCEASNGEVGLCFVNGFDLLGYFCGLW